jgi:nucleoside 2-deoxyribosyltransferase
MKVYLAGAISGLSYGNATGWREYAFEKLHKAEIDAYSPMRGKAYLSGVAEMTEEELKQFQGKTIQSIVGINVRDYNDVKTSDAILVNLLNAEKVSIGTVMEIAWARAFQVPTVIVMEKGNIHNHGMLTYGNIITDNLDEGIMTIIQLLKP